VVRIYAQVKRPKGGRMTQAETVKLFGWREHTSPTLANDGLARAHLTQLSFGSYRAMIVWRGSLFF
jgi:hypothetical protein